MEKVKKAIVQFLFGAEGVNKGDCMTYSYESILWMLVIWFASFDKWGFPIYLIFIPWGLILYFLWRSYFKAKKKQAEEDMRKAAEKEND